MIWQPHETKPKQFLVHIYTLLVRSFYYSSKSSKLQNFNVEIVHTGFSGKLGFAAPLVSDQPHPMQILSCPNKKQKKIKCRITWRKKWTSMTSCNYSYKVAPKINCLITTQRICHKRIFLSYRSLVEEWKF